MSMREFLKENREKIDDYIRSQCPNVGKLTNDARREWIANDERLYWFAKHAGVKI